VVLPDKERSDRDEIIFLHEEHAAGDETDAQQLGAVAALAGLARDLPLERVLPQEFRPLFQTIRNEVRHERRHVSTFSESDAELWWRH